MNNQLILNKQNLREKIADLENRLYEIESNYQECEKLLKIKEKECEEL